MKPRELNFYRPSKIPKWGIIFVFAIGVAVLGGFWVLAGPDYTKEVLVVNESTSATLVKPTPEFTILSKIQEGIELLKKSQPLKYDKSKKEIALAILNKDTREIFEQRVWVREDEIKNYKKTGTISLEPVLLRSNLNSGNLNSGGLTSTEVQKPILIKVNWWNSFNTDYEIPEHPELVVVANKYPFPSSYLSGLPEKSAKQYTDIVYAPYSNGLQSFELIVAGKKYLEENINQAFAELDSKKVASLSGTRVPVTVNISKDFISNIILVEHIDPDNFNVAIDGGKELSERVLTVIGANQQNAYRYTGSPAGASGLAQFIKSTYDLMVARYPQAKLIKNYNAGMANHVNAIKAMVLFFDSHKKNITGKITRRDIVQSLGITEEMLAATYNGGPSRVASSVNKFGLAWISGQLRLPASAKVLRQETLNYIKKFQAIKGLNMFR